MSVCARVESCVHLCVRPRARAGTDTCLGRLGCRGTWACLCPPGVEVRGLLCAPRVWRYVGFSVPPGCGGTCTCLCPHGCGGLCVRTCVPVCASVCLCVSLCACVRVCVCVRVSALGPEVYRRHYLSSPLSSASCWGRVGCCCLTQAYPLLSVLQAPDPAQLAVVLFVGCTCSSSLCAVYYRKAPSAVKQCLFCCDCA